MCWTRTSENLFRRLQRIQKSCKATKCKTQNREREIYLIFVFTERILFQIACEEMRYSFLGQGGTMLNPF